MVFSYRFCCRLLTKEYSSFPLRTEKPFQGDFENGCSQYVNKILEN